MLFLFFVLLLFASFSLNTQQHTFLFRSVCAFFNIKSWQNVIFHFFLDANGLFPSFLRLIPTFLLLHRCYSVRLPCIFFRFKLCVCSPPSVILRVTADRRAKMSICESKRENLSRCVTRKRMEKVNNCCSRFVILLGMFVFCRPLSNASRTHDIDDITFICGLWNSPTRSLDLSLCPLFAICLFGLPLAAERNVMLQLLPEEKNEDVLLNIECPVADVTIASTTALRHDAPIDGGNATDLSVMFYLHDIPSNTWANGVGNQPTTLMMTKG